MLFAAQRTIEDAAAIAANFSNAQSRQSNGIRRAARKASDVRLSYQVAKPNSTEPALFVFNKPEGGWVIVSADDNARDVLAYSNEGKFDGSKSNVAYMLDYYAERIAKARPMADEKKARRAASEDESYVFQTIAPLLGSGTNAIQWNQTPPFNNICPIDTADFSRSYTGCVATAAAQIMMYWKWPAQGMGACSYTWHSDGGGGGHESVDFSTATYNWDNMLPQYHDGQYTEEQAYEIAHLLYHVGVSTHMVYGGDATGGSGSGGSSMARAMHENFGYTQGTQHDNWDKKPYIEEAQAFETELKTGRPILMGGNGHAYLCDGADGTGRFHINWGWGGLSDGYYYLYALKPNSSGIGANDTEEGYAKGMDCFFGIEPLPESARIHPTGFALNKTHVNLKIREKATLESIFTPYNVTNKGVYYISGDERVATVNRDGVIIGISAGSTTITAKTCDGGYTATCHINVANEYVQPKQLTFDNVFECKWDSAKAHFTIGLKNISQGEYPYIIFNFKKRNTNAWTIAGYYEVGENDIVGWVSAAEPEYIAYSKSGWMNITCLGGNTYKIEGNFIDNEGFEYTFNHTASLNMKGASLTDQSGDGTQHIVTFMVLGETFKTLYAANGKLALPSDKPLGCDDMTFVGWCKQEDYNSTTAPTFAKPGDPINANTTYYAVFGTPTGERTPYTAVASITFKSATSENSERYDPGFSFNSINNLIESSVNTSVQTGQWLRWGTNGLIIGDHSTGCERKLDDDGWYKQGFVTFGLNQEAVVSKVAVNCAKRKDDKGRLQIDINEIHSIYNPVFDYSENVEYVLAEPTYTHSFTLATNHGAAYIKSATLYTGGDIICSYYSTTCQAEQTSYNITIASTAHGTIQSNVAEAEEGEVITLTTTATNGYRLAAIRVVDANNQPISVLHNTAFVMPASDVTISATFEAIAQGYTEVASIVFWQTDNNYAWYDPGYRFEEIGNLIESSNGLTVTDGSWLRPGEYGIRIGGCKYDEYQQDSPGYITLTLDEAAVITKVVVNCAKSHSNDNGKLKITLGNRTSGSSFSYSNNVTYTPSNPTAVSSVKLATTKRAAAIRSVTLYTGSDNRPFYAPNATAGMDAVEAAEDQSATKTIENGQVVIIRGSEKYTIFGQKIQ